MLTRLVIPWVAALVLEASPFEMGLLLVADVVAGAAGSLVLGTLVDRASKRRVMIGADLARAAIVALLALAVWRGVATIPLLVVAAAASGLLSITFELARSAWIAQNVHARALTVRNSQLSAAGSVTEAVSFGVGGWIYQALGGALSLAADAVSYLVSAAFLWRMRERRRAAPAATGWPRAADVWADARAGVTALWRDRTLRALAVLEVLVALGMSLAGTSYMIYVAREIGFDTGVLGMIFAVGGVGSALGAALAPASGRRAGSGMAIVSGLLLLAGGATLVPLAGRGSAGWPPARRRCRSCAVRHSRPHAAAVGDAGRIVGARGCRHPHAGAKCHAGRRAGGRHAGGGHRRTRGPDRFGWDVRGRGGGRACAAGAAAALRPRQPHCRAGHRQRDARHGRGWTGARVHAAPWPG